MAGACRQCYPSSAAGKFRDFAACDDARGRGSHFRRARGQEGRPDRLRGRGMAHQFEVTQAKKSFLKVRHPVEELTFTFHVVEGHGGRRTLGIAPRQKGAVASKAAHYARAMPAFAEARHAGAIETVGADLGPITKRPCFLVTSLASRAPLS